MTGFQVLKCKTDVARDCKAWAKKKGKGSHNVRSRPVVAPSEDGTPPPVSASMYLQFDSLLGNVNPEKTLQRLQDAKVPIAVDAETMEYLAKQEERVEQQVMYSNFAQSKAASDPFVDRAEKLNIEREASRAQEALQATKRVRKLLLKDFEALSGTRETTTKAAIEQETADTMQSLTQQLDAVLSMVRDGKFVDGRLEGSMQGKKGGAVATKVPPPVLQPRPARIEGDIIPARTSATQSNAAGEWASDTNTGSDEDMMGFSADDMYKKFASMLKRSPMPTSEVTSTPFAEAVSSSMPRSLDNPNLQRPTPRRPRVAAADDDDLDLAAAMDEALPDEHTQISAQGRLVTGAFLQDQIREERQAEVRRKLASASRPLFDGIASTAAPETPKLTREDMLKALGPTFKATPPSERAAPLPSSALVLPSEQQGELAASGAADNATPSLSTLQAPKRVTQRPKLGESDEEQLAAAIERTIKEEANQLSRAKSSKAAQPQMRAVKAVSSTPSTQPPVEPNTSGSQASAGRLDSNAETLAGTLTPPEPAPGRATSSSPLSSTRASSREAVSTAADANDSGGMRSDGTPSMEASSLLERPVLAAKSKAEQRTAPRNELRTDFNRMKSAAKPLMEAQTNFYGKVIQANSGGVVLHSEEHGLLGFVPHRELSGYNQQRLITCQKSLAIERGVTTQLMTPSLIGQLRRDAMLMLLGATLRVKVSEIVEDKGFLLFSERNAYRLNAGLQGSYHPAILEELLRNIGMRLTVRVSALTAFGAFVTFDSDVLGILVPHDPTVVTGMVHASQISWDPRRMHPSDMLSVGQEVVAKVTSVDGTKGYVALSIKQAADDPLLQTMDSLATKVSMGSNQLDLTQLPNQISQFLNRLSSIKSIETIKVEQVVDGPAQAQGLQVWLGKEHESTEPHLHKAAIRFGNRIVVVRIVSHLPRPDLRDILRGLST